MISRIDPLPEGLNANAPYCLQEGLLHSFTLLDIHGENCGNRRSHCGLRHRGSDDFPERDLSAGRAAKRNLIPLLAALFDPEDADMADVVMATGIHAA